MLWIALGAALGAPARYLTDRAIQASHDSAFPWGTLTVNVAGSFLLGILTALGSSLDPALAAALGVGFCGTLTTYSAFSYETLRLSEDGAWFSAATNVLVSLTAGFGAAALGWVVGLALGPQS